MATKPTDKTFTHATDDNFASGPATGLPTKVVPPTASQGFVPGTGITARFLNWLFNTLGQWTGWLNAGSSAAGEDAHIVETDADGRTAVAGIVAGGTSAAFAAISASQNSGATGSTISATNSGGGFAVVGSVDGASAAIRGVTTGTGPALEAIGPSALRGPTTMYTHASTGDWRDDYRPQNRTFMASGQTPEQFGVDVDIPITTSSATSNTLFPRGTGSGYVYFEISLGLIIGDQPDTTPKIGNIAHRYHARWDVIATLNDGVFTQALDGTVVETSTGLAVDVSCGAVVDSDNIIVRVSIGESNADDAPYRIGVDVKMRRITVTT